MANTPSAQKEMLRFVVPLFLALVILAIAIVKLPLSWNRLTTLLCWLWPLIAFLIAFIMYFFRDPERYVPADESIIVSAADGLVVGIDEMEEPDFHLGPMIRVSVFLSVFDVHINRTPCDGMVKSTVYKAGKFLDVRHPQSSQLNEARAWWLETPHGDVAVRQIAGPHRAPHRRLGRRRHAAPARPAFRHDPLRLAHRSLPARRVHHSRQDRRPCPRRRHPHRALARVRAKGKRKRAKGLQGDLLFSFSPFAFCPLP